MAGAHLATWSTQDVAESFAQWWRDVGLHSLTTAQAHGWLEEEAPHPATPVRAEPAEVQRAETPAAPTRRAARHAMPNDLAAFRDWLAEDPAQPEAHWSGPACLPPATAGARLLILCDMPDAAADNPGSPFTPGTRRFLAAMLGAIGLRSEAAAIAPLAFRRPPGGLIDDPTMVLLANRTRHWLGLVGARAVLILGDRTSRALLATQMPAPTDNLLTLHYAGGTLPAAALPSPEHLMRRPRAKEASWQALRLLIGAIAP
jgi:uracil-DNA glycosylase